MGGPFNKKVSSANVLNFSRSKKLEYFNYLEKKFQESVQGNLKVIPSETFWKWFWTSSSQMELIISFLIDFCQRLQWTWILRSYNALSSAEWHQCWNYQYHDCSETASKRQISHSVLRLHHCYKKPTYYRCNNYVDSKDCFCVNAWTWRQRHSHLRSFDNWGINLGLS